MLRHLLVSRVRIKLLECFFGSPQKMFYGRQLSRKTGEQINAVRRELKNLLSAGVLKSERRANRIYFFLNRDYRFYAPLLAIFSQETGLGKKIIKNRHRLGKLKVVFFSQSFARGEKKEENGVDILIVGRVILPELAVLIKEEEERREREINYTVMDEKEFLFRFHGRDPFLVDFLVKPRIIILGDEERLIK